MDHAALREEIKKCFVALEQTPPDSSIEHDARLGELLLAAYEARSAIDDDWRENNRRLAASRPKGAAQSAPTTLESLA